MVYDFHTHSTLSDGSLSPLELIHRADVANYRAIAITDHAGVGGLGRLAGELAADCALARLHSDIIALPGVELTHVPPGAIAEAARQARAAGALVVVVHQSPIPALAPTIHPRPPGPHHLGGGPGCGPAAVVLGAIQ
jgi:histidinol phosphatase-like PHP family hydrolase